MTDTEYKDTLKYLETFAGTRSEFGVKVSNYITEIKEKYGVIVKKVKAVKESFILSFDNFKSKKN